MVTSEATDNQIKTNYLLATWSGARRDGATYGNYTYNHLQFLGQTKHSLTQITIGWPEDPNIVPAYAQYMEKLHGTMLGSAIVVVEKMNNEGRSYGQWAKMYDRHNDFDYFFFMEDDYPPVCHNFDSILIEMFDQFYFEKNCGYLCGMVNRLRFRNHIKPNTPLHAAVSWGISNKEVLSRIVKRRGSLPYDVGKLYHQGQNLFSFGFTEEGYTLQDVLQKYNTPYWKDSVEFYGNSKNPVLIAPIQYAIEQKFFDVVSENFFS